MTGVPQPPTNGAPTPRTAGAKEPRMTTANQLSTQGLDLRYGWSSMTVAVHIVAFVLLAAGMVLIGWTFATNRFASSAVRIARPRAAKPSATTS